MTSTLHLQLLGNFRIVRDGALVTSINTPRLQSFLTYLLLHCEAPQLRQHISFRFWPDSSETQARTNLRKLFYQLRQALPDADCFLLSNTQILQWKPDAPFTADVTELQERLARAREQPDDPELLRGIAALYQGELLPGCYDEWIFPVREQLHQGVRQALEQLVRLLEEQGNYQDALQYAHRLLELGSLHEAPYRQLMRLYYQLGDRAVALQVYHECVATFERELGVEPGPATRGLYEQIRDEEEAPTLSQRSLVRVGTATTPFNNLPHTLTSFVGREREQAELVALLREPSCRLLTLTGTGGTGKTRLAIEVAHSLLRDFADGVCFVNLAPISDPAIVIPTIARALDITEEGSQPLGERLAAFLAHQHLLLVLDNFEQLLEAGPKISQLLGRTATLKVLVTSRVTLDLYGEHLYPVPPLSLPDPEQLPPVDHLPHYEALHLFVERARAASHTFEFARDNATEVTAICQRLDGLPLAIELAAARIRSFSPHTLLERLDSRLALLDRGPRDAPARHQGLRAAIEWSYHLLHPHEQRLFARLAVFAGGCTMEAVEAVCDVGGDLCDPLESLLSLVDQNLLRQEAGEGGAPRFVMLETIREYARERLEASDELEVLSRRHANFFVVLAEEARPGSNKVWLQRLEAEHNNLRAALSWGLAWGEVEIVCRLAGASHLFWYIGGHVQEGRKWLEAALAQGEAAAPVLRVKVLAAAWLMAMAQNDYCRSEALMVEQLAVCREIDDHRGVAIALSGLGWMAQIQGAFEQAIIYYQEGIEVQRGLGSKSGVADALMDLVDVRLDLGDIERAGEHLVESLALAREADDKHGLARAFYLLGRCACYQDDSVRAMALLNESLLLFRELENKRGIGAVLHELGRVAVRKGNQAEARVLLQDSLKLFQEVEEKYFCVGALETFAIHMNMQGQVVRAARLWGAIETLREAIQFPRPPVARTEYECSVATIRARLDEETFTATWTEGRAMTLEEAIAYALDLTS